MSERSTRLKKYVEVRRKAQAKRDAIIGLLARVAVIENTLGLDEDPNLRRARSSNLTSLATRIGGTVGWLGSLKALEFAGGQIPEIHPVIDQAKQIAPWIACGYIGEWATKVSSNAGVWFSLRRTNRTDLG